MYLNLTCTSAKRPGATSPSSPRYCVSETEKWSPAGGRTLIRLRVFDVLRSLSGASYTSPTSYLRNLQTKNNAPVSECLGNHAMLRIAPHKPQARTIAITAMKVSCEHRQDLCSRHEELPSKARDLSGFRYPGFWDHLSKVTTPGEASTNSFRPMTGSAPAPAFVTIVDSSSTK
jgi:hypothetical protein